jgi:hypothetical protein
MQPDHHHLAGPPRTAGSSANASRDALGAAFAVPDVRLRQPSPAWASCICSAAQGVEQCGVILVRLASVFWFSI